MVGLPTLRGASEEPEEGTLARTERPEEAPSDEADSEALTHVRTHSSVHSAPTLSLT